MAPRCAPPCLRAVTVLLLWFHFARERQALGEKLEPDPMADDDNGAVQRLRGRLTKDTLNETYGVLLVSGPEEIAWSRVTIPIWRSYCERHKLGFFLQQEQLNTELAFEWAKPRVLMELLPRAKWKYVFLVDGSSLPVNLNKSWVYAINEHMKYRRFANDNPAKRRIFCPWDCEEEYERALDEGACYGPLLSGCIFWARRQETLELVKSWYAKRRGNYTSDQALVQAFGKMKERHWGEVFLKDVQKEMGRKTSSFLASFAYDASYGWNVRDQIFDYIAEHSDLRKLANSVREHNPSEL